MTSSKPPWVWDNLPGEVRAESWRRLADWVRWLEEAYEPWVVLPPCWPVHEGLRTELAMFWYWHRWLSTAAMNPVDGVGWHSELRHAAAAWAELAGCKHEPPAGRHHELRRARVDRFLALAQRPETQE